MSSYIHPCTCMFSNSSLSYVKYKVRVTFLCAKKTLLAANSLLLLFYSLNDLIDKDSLTWPGG